jgi:hypothetical protein
MLMLVTLLGLYVGLELWLQPISWSISWIERVAGAVLLVRNSELDLHPVDAWLQLVPTGRERGAHSTGRAGPLHSTTSCRREGPLVRMRSLFVAVLMTGFCANALPADPREIEQKVSELNAQSVRLLGVSLNALRYLVSAEPNSYLLLWHLERTGEINYIRELEAKGYVKAQTVQSLPDGTQRNERFLRVIPVGAGIELQRCVLALQHDGVLQPTR